MRGPLYPAVGRVLCLAGAAIGALGLVGWITGLPFLLTIVPGQPPMMPNTAVGLLLAGGAGALRSRESAGTARKVLSLLAAAALLALGVGTLAEYALNVDLRIDQLLIESHIGPYPGRPSPPTALALACLGAAIALFDVRPAARARPPEWFALGAALIAFMALLGQLFGAGPLYRLTRAPVIGVALPTAIGLLLTALGLLFERPHAGLMRLATAHGPGSIQLRRLALLAVLGPIALAFVSMHIVAAATDADLPMVFAILAGAMTVTSLALLCVTALPLNRVHEALESSRARTVALIEQASDAIFVADLDGRYTDVNSAGCRMLGYTREALLDKTILDLIRTEDTERLERHKARLLEGSTEVSEWQIRRADGSYVPVEVSAKILPDGRWQGLVRDISERKRAEDRLRESEKRLDLALRGADLGTWDWNVETGEVIFNARWAKMRGFLPEEVKPHVDSWSAGVHPEDWLRVQQALNEHFQDLTPEYEAEHRVLTKSGTWIWILDRGRVFDRDAHGRPLRMAGTELDITERKRTEAALRLSEAKSSRILAISADAMISIDEDQRITMFNEGAERIFGYTKAEAIGAPLDMLLPERFRAIHRRHVEGFAAGGEAARRMGERGTMIYGLRKHGVEFPADAAISKLEVGGQRLLTVALRDVTEQHRIEAEQKFLAEVGSELAATLDYEDTLISVARLGTKSLCDLCIVGVAGEEGAIEFLKAVSRDTSRAWVADLVERILLDRRSAQLFDSALKLECTLLVQGSSPEFVAWSARHAEHLRPLGDLVPHAVILAPLEARGRRLGAVALVSTTPARSYGAADVRLAEQLAYRAALSIESARLYRIARRAIRVRDDVLGIVAHDLRSPLGTMLLQSELLKNPGADPEHCARKAAERIDRAATRMNRLIQDLLDVTRLEAGRLSIQPSRLQPGQIIAETRDAQKPLAAAASLELEVDVAPNTPEVWADRHRLLQAFENLVGNAIKFTPPGGLIRLGVEGRKGEVLFWVRDTGAGIAPEHLPHLFDRFWQAQKDGRRGAGLGLPIVKGIVEAHGGRIWVESTPGRGTVFFFTISAARPAELSAPRRASAPSRRRDRTPS